MKYRYLYVVKSKIAHKSGKLDELNLALTDAGAGFTLEYKTDDLVEVMNFNLDISLKDGERAVFPVDWQEELIETVKEVFERHQLVLSDTYLELVDKFELKEDEE